MLEFSRIYRSIHSIDFDGGEKRCNRKNSEMQPMNNDHVDSQQVKKAKEKVFSNVVPSRGLIPGLYSCMVLLKIHGSLSIRSCLNLSVPKKSKGSGKNRGIIIENS